MWCPIFHVNSLLIVLLLYQFKGLNVRVGIEAFFCVVRNTPTYHMNPVWFFTSEALMNYMPTAVPLHKPWDLAFIGAKLEAFAIAGCDVVSKFIIIHLGIRDRNHGII